MTRNGEDEGNKTAQSWGVYRMRSNAMVMDFIQELGRRDTADDIGQAFHRFIGNFGFSYFCIGSFKSDPHKFGRGSVWASTRTGWFKHWVTQYVKDDPVVWQLRQQQQPFRWSDVRRAAPDRLQLRMFDDAYDFGIREGWAAGFQLGPHDLAGIGLGTSKCELDPEDEVTLQLGSLYCGLKLTQATRGISPNPLTERERECLRWVAAGKTDWEISRILSISEKTAQEHVRRALTKLNASTRAQAVATAILGNLIAL